mmetsp:Transcript_63667/g.180823  ORF Transcript_63667/g.180823 Transcript_63667/m.180823 type:complete len:295 (-) Transcript_63667:38-922(-)|eukprot:CAMPEP_0168357410 /NCGR_PEP_ID=MMETSP0228-20121227/571_1 /TAXON_ID=133427 /ORGANISM="Protoceratium reticulatum, Strain CCCM 535 (=CCMP 1889)" /LENGTH=294 /DNA_ID=CAMNT_0008369925 /DNA_START=51 /DNA_END=935 /DNA_ORIENTATION=-
MKVIVTCMSGRAIEVDTEEEILIVDLKAKLANELNLPAILQSLTAGGLLLDNRTPLSTLHHTSDEPLRLEMVLQPCGITSNYGITKVRGILDELQSVNVKENMAVANAIVGILVSVHGKKGWAWQQLRTDAWKALSGTTPIINSFALIKTLAGAGYDQSEIRQSCFTFTQLAEAGYADANLGSAGHTLAQMKEDGYTVSHIFEVARQSKQFSYSIEELKDVGFTDAQMARAGYSYAQLKAADMAAQVRRQLNYCQLKSGGFSAEQMRDDGFSFAQLKEAGSKTIELKSGGYVQL